MAQNTIYLSGTAKWAKVNLDQLDTQFDKEGVWSIDLYLDAASLDTFKKSGSRLKVHQDDDGVFIKLKRKRFMQKKEDKIDIGPPAVRDVDDNNFDGIIGNGSKVTCRVEVYDSKMYGKGSRLVAVRVDDLVEFTGERQLPVLEEGVPF